MRRFLPILILVVSCTGETKTEPVEPIQSVNCKKELGSILSETEFLNFKGELFEISEWNPNWLENYTDSAITNEGLYLELKADSTFHILIDCGYRSDNLCQHAIYPIPQLNNQDYINFFEYVICDASFLAECGFDIHQHSHAIHTSKSSLLGSSNVHGEWKLDSSSTENPPFNYLSTRGSINGMIKSENTKSGFKLIDLPYSQEGTALNHKDSSDFILHCLIATGTKLVLEDRKNQNEPIQYYFSAK